MKAQANISPIDLIAAHPCDKTYLAVMVHASLHIHAVSLEDSLFALRQIINVDTKTLTKSCMFSNIHMSATPTIFIQMSK